MKEDSILCWLMLHGRMKPGGQADAADSPSASALSSYYYNICITPARWQMDYLMTELLEPETVLLSRLSILASITSSQCT